jgi:hypothetical protein
MTRSKTESLVDQKKMVQVSARIPLEDRRALKLLAAREDTSIQELIAEAIRALVRSRRKPAAGSK